MRKFPKAFTRRKSTANALEDLENTTPVEGSFKVFDRNDRTDTGSKSFDGGIKLANPTSGASRQVHTAPVEDNMFENLGNFRASDGSSSNTASLTTTDKSSRLSAASTTPSSTDLPGRNEEWKSPHDKPFSNIPMPPALKSSATFSLKNAGRSLSWGRSKPSPPTTPKDVLKSKELPSIPQSEDSYSSRSRTVTVSSYASTATPPKIEDKELGLSMGGDFAEMFAGFGKRKSVVMTPDRVMSQSPETLPPAPAQSNRFNSPARLTIDNSRQIEEPPYSWGTQASNDGLMANRSPPPLSTSPSHPPPPVPLHTQNRTNSDIRMVSSQQARPGATSTDGLRRSSALAGRRQSTLEYKETVDEDARLLRESVSASRRLDTSSSNTRVRDNWAVPFSSRSRSRDNSITPSWRADSMESTPKPNQLYDPPRPSDDNMFDNQIAAAADLAARFEEVSLSRPEPPKKVESLNKVMTPAQFERYKQDQERMRSYGIKPKEDDDDEVDQYDDEEDEAEKAKQAAKQRRKQEAHMAVYRQQMMKVTGESSGPRPGLLVSQSTPDLVNAGKDDGADEDEEIPLAILQAHGFPNKNRPPRNMGSHSNLRASTMPTGGGEGRLPVFARGLPQDPYYGAGLQRPMHRESMAFGGGAQSVSGAQPRGAAPGGLVGVIASEERSRAIRRGSPNAQGDFGPASPNMYGGVPGEMGPMSMNPMMMTPGDHAQAQMAGQMQQLMQMQMHIMHMMSQGQGAPSIQGPSQMMPMQGDMPRPNSSHNLRPGSGQPSHQRAMTMMEPNAAPWMQPGNFSGTPSIRIHGYTPSIAPSERSNIGLPGRYRPVSHMPMASDNKSRLSTMSGALPNWEAAKPVATSTIRPVQRSGNASDEDDEDGWEEMARKKRERKSTWKSKRNTESFRDILHFS